MTVGARLRSKAASSFARRGHLGRSRGAGDEETDAIVEHLEVEDEDPASQEGEHEDSGRRAGTPSARRVHLAALPERSAVAPGPFVTRRLQLGRSGPAWRAPRSSRLHLSPKADVKNLISYVVTKTRAINGTYHRFLGRHFPRFYALYTVFMKGIQMLWADGKKARRIKANMWKHNVKFHQLSYREMEHLRQFRRDITKCLFVGIISIPPFANYLVFLLMYLFPRQLLVKHFWTPKQQIDFLDIYHSLRKQSHSEIITHLERASALVSDERLRWHLTDLCTKVQNGVHPTAHDILALRECFSTRPLGFSQLQATHMACYLRGLNSTHIADDRCRTWLGEWLQISCSLKETELSLLLHNVVLLSTNYLETRR